MSGREDVIESEGYAGDMNDGIITRSVSYLYNAIAERARKSRTTLSASYLEIYNEGESRGFLLSQGPASVGIIHFMVAVPSWRAAA